MFEGMDPAAVERLGTLISLSAESWRRAGEELRALLNALAWKGPDAEAFANAVEGAHAHFTALAETLRNLARTLEEQAAEQRRASSVAR